MTIASQVPKGTQAETVLEEVDKESVSRGYRRGHGLTVDYDGRGGSGAPSSINGA